jgi:hypothetical protein
MLTKVLRTNGQRRFFFAYGSGKRTDGNGDGHLIVAVKKPKKSEVQAACACQTFVEGSCWSSLDGGIVFFQSLAVPLAAATVTKMAQTAKRMTGRPFDFQLPSPEEATRAASLAEGEDEQQPGPAPPRAPEASQPEPAAAPSLEARWVKRRATLEPAYLAALKDQRGDATKMQALFAFAVEKAKASQYDRALQALDHLEKMLGAAPPAPTAAPGPEVQFQQRLKGLAAQVLKSAIKGPTLDAVKQALSAAQTSARQQDFAKAKAVLDRVDGVLKQAAAAGSPAAPPVPAPSGPESRSPSQPTSADTFRTAWTAARSDLQTAIDKVSDQLAEFAGALLDTGESNLVWVAEEGLGELLSSLRDAALTIERATSKTPAKVAAKARPGIDNLRKQLQSARVRACDDNQLGVTVTIHGTIGQALKRLEGALALASTG